MQRVLVIEDNENNMELITFILQEHGFESLRATTGIQGVETVTRERPDFILLDIQLPDIDGVEVLKRIRSTEIGAKVPVIAVTSYAMAGDRQKLLAAGCNGYIEKPIDPMQVINQITKTVLEQDGDDLAKACQLG